MSDFTLIFYLLLFLSVLFLVLAFVLSMCYISKRSDEIMHDILRKEREKFLSKEGKKDENISIKDIQMRASVYST